MRGLSTPHRRARAGADAGDGALVALPAAVAGDAAAAAEALAARPGDAVLLAQADPLRDAPARAAARALGVPVVALPPAPEAAALCASLAAGWRERTEAVRWLEAVVSACRRPGAHAAPRSVRPEAAARWAARAWRPCPECGGGGTAPGGCARCGGALDGAS